jgi:hypothetical protein
VEPPQELPDLPQNAAVLDFLLDQASLPSGPGDYTLGAWQLHTHPDLMARLCELAPGCPLTAAYGVPLLASEGIAAVVALGTDWLAVRVGCLPPEIETEDPAPEWSFARGDWHVISPWQSQLSGADALRILAALVSAALAHAASLALVYVDEASAQVSADQQVAGAMAAERESLSLECRADPAR